MYYYIFDPPVGAKEYERTAQIKELLSNLAITGELSQPGPGKSVEDLVHNAISKRYSTIVAVGGMSLINQVARAVVPYDLVFGIIPTQPHPDITNLIGTSDWKIAAEHLKRRRWLNTQIGSINKTVCFLTPAHIDIPERQSFLITTSQFSIEGNGGTVDIIPARSETTDLKLTVELHSNTIQPNKGLLGRFFKQTTAGSEDTRFTTTELTLETEYAYPVLVAGVEVAQTSIRCTSEGKPLRLIIARGSAPKAEEE